MSAKKNKKDEMSFLEHLEELRWHIIRSVIAIFLIGIVAFVFNEILFDDIILGPRSENFFTNKALCNLGKLLNKERLCINREISNLQNIHMTGQFMAHIKISLIAGLVLAFPYILVEFWKFINPALYENEKTKARGIIFYSTLLFLLGILFGYYIISPLSVNFLENYKVSDTISNEITLMSYVSIIASIVLASGLLFELPIIIFFLSKLGIISPAFLKKYRRHALVVILTISAIITPPDIFSQILIAVPLLGLYEIGISISKRVQKKQQNELQG